MEGATLTARERIWLQVLRMLRYGALPVLVIAEPLPSVLQRFRYIAGEIRSPQLLLSIASTSLHVFADSDLLIAALRYMKDNDFSQVIVRSGSNFALMSTEGVARFVEINAATGALDFSTTQIADVLKAEPQETHAVLPATASVYDGQQEFLSSVEGPAHLYAIVISDNGERSGQTLGIVTPIDLLKAK